MESCNFQALNCNPTTNLSGQEQHDRAGGGLHSFQEQGSLLCKVGASIWDSRGVGCNKSMDGAAVGGATALCQQQKSSLVLCSFVRGHAFPSEVMTSRQASTMQDRAQHIRAFACNLKRKSLPRRNEKRSGASGDRGLADQRRA